MKPLRLLHVTGDSCFGGAGRIIRRLGQVAQAEGWQVDVLSTDAVVQREMSTHGLGLIDLDVIRRKIRPLWDLGGLFRLRDFLLRERYTIVHTHTSKGGFIGRLAARLAGVPVIIHTAHGFAFHELSSHTTRFFYSSLERVASRWCDRIVSVSEFHRDWALELGLCTPEQILAIPNGIPALPPPEVARAAVRQRLGVNNHNVLILSMARLAPDKGLQYLLDAAAVLLQKERHFRFVIAGDGPVRSRLEQQSRDLGLGERVTFLGFREDVSELLDASDVVVLPSIREGLSIALLEAMAAGKPIVTTSIGSNQELARQSEMAVLVPPADAGALCEAILRVVDNRFLMGRLGVNARDLFDKHYREERMLSAYTELYRDLVRKKCPAETATKSIETTLYRTV
jgi:glycosyltransferase involved in cell wall biosynthesis